MESQKQEDNDEGAPAPSPKPEMPKADNSKAIAEKVERAVDNFTKMDENGANLKNLYVFFENSGISNSDVDKAIELLKSESKIFEPKNEYYKRVE
jgi:DNA replicative helicase MCM subunit Mcm2 (Cdc46/Mcm family)